MKDLRFKRKYFMMIYDGSKKLEARINYPFLRDIKAGDIVEFFWEHMRMAVRITAVRQYNDFASMLRREDPKLLVPGMSREEALTEYRSIYSDEKVRRNGGVLVFAFEPTRR